MLTDLPISCKTCTEHGIMVAEIMDVKDYMLW